MSNDILSDVFWKLHAGEARDRFFHTVRSGFTRQKAENVTRTHCVAQLNARVCSYWSMANGGGCGWKWWLDGRISSARSLCIRCCVRSPQSNTQLRMVPPGYPPSWRTFWTCRPGFSLKGPSGFSLKGPFWAFLVFPSREPFWSGIFQRSQRSFFDLSPQTLFAACFLDFANRNNQIALPRIFPKMMKWKCEDRE